MQNGHVQNQEPHQQSFSEVVRAHAEEKQREYLNLQHEQRRISIRLERLKASIDHLNGVLEDEGIPTVQTRELTDKGFARPGNRSKNMPLRKPEWEGMSLADAVKSILGETDQTIHADVLVHRVYEIEIPSEKRQAKHSLVSTLRTGAKNGLWHAEPKNQYRAIDDPQPAMAGV